MMGKPLEHTEPAGGLNKLTCDVKIAAANNCRGLIDILFDYRVEANNTPVIVDMMQNTYLLLLFGYWKVRF